MDKNGYLGERLNLNSAQTIVMQNININSIIKKGHKMSKQSELKAINYYIDQYVKRWEIAKEQWVKVMIWELMIKRSRLQFKGE